jgi:ribose transport system permease protein
MQQTTRARLGRWLADYSMVLVLLLLAGYFSWATLAEQYPTGRSAGARLGDDVVRQTGAGSRVLIAIRATRDDEEFADALAARLKAAGITPVAVLKGKPADIREALEDMARRGEKIDRIAASRPTGTWPVLQDLGRQYPPLGDVPVVMPAGYLWPNFLKPDNLLNIANQIAVIAIIAIGMTMVIITGGIDLSVGSLIALAAVTATLLIRDLAGAEHASTAGMVLCCTAAIVVCALVGTFSGTLVTLFQLPPFLVTLATMLMASGVAFLLTGGQSVFQVPDRFIWLGRGADLLDIPNAVVLTLVLYLVAHVVMARMTLGRYLYAVGGNAEAARLSGVPVNRILLLAYTLSGALAGLGGVVMASQLKSGAPTYGQMYELYVIAAVVVGGTSLSGGEGQMFGTLLGALLIAVIQNGMNLTGVESYTQKVVLGAVILGAVLLDRLKKRSWRLPRFLARVRPVPEPVMKEQGSPCS